MARNLPKHFRTIAPRCCATCIDRGVGELGDPLCERDPHAEITVELGNGEDIWTKICDYYKSSPLTGQGEK